MASASWTMGAPDRPAPDPGDPARYARVRQATTAALDDVAPGAHPGPAVLAAVATAAGWVAGALWAPLPDGKLAHSASWAPEGHERRSLRTIAHVAAAAGTPTLGAGELAFPARSRAGVEAILAFGTHDTPADDSTLPPLLADLGSEIGHFLARRRALIHERPRLSRRETEVLALVAEGMSSHRIATELTISQRTVKSHLEHIYARLGVSDRSAAVALALRGGLID